MPTEPTRRLQKEVDVQGYEADSRDFAGVEAVLVEEVGDVSCDLDDWEKAVGEVRDMHKHGEIVHRLGHRDLELPGKRRVSRPVQDLGGER